MAFSFSPGQIAPQGSQAMAPPGTVAPGTAVAPGSTTPSDSPFFFIRERSEGKPLSVFACIQIVLVVVAILSVFICGTLYAYSVYLKSTIASNKLELESKDATLPDYPYDDMAKLSKRMGTLDLLLQNYISPRSPLKFLENVVENQVVFDNFALTRTNAGTYNVTFNAITNNYKVLAQQLDALNLTEYKKVAPDPKLGGVTDVSTNIKISVTTPVFVQGKLPDDVVFFADVPKTATSTANTQTAQTVSSTTPVNTNTTPK